MLKRDEEILRHTFTLIHLTPREGGGQQKTWRSNELLLLLTEEEEEGIGNVFVV